MGMGRICKRNVKYGDFIRIDVSTISDYKYSYMLVIWGKNKPIDSKRHRSYDVIVGTNLDGGLMTGSCGIGAGDRVSEMTLNEYRFMSDFLIKNKLRYNKKKKKLIIL
jgi:hypothetical protein